MAFSNLFSSLFNSLISIPFSFMFVSLNCSNVLATNFLYEHEIQRINNLERSSANCVNKKRFCGRHLHWELCPSYIWILVGVLSDVKCAPKSPRQQRKTMQPTTNQRISKHPSVRVSQTMTNHFTVQSFLY